MLTVYTPEQPSTDLRAHALGVFSGRYNTPAACLSGTGLALKSSWCRELVTDDLKRLFTDMPPGTLNIYGIRKHGVCGISYQPRGPGKITRTNMYTENLLKSFTKLMVELISCVLDDNTMSSTRIKGWLYRWGSIGFGRDYSVSGNPVGPTVKFLLNSDPDDTPELQTGFWADGNMHGTITGIPSHWANSIPIMSYLLYLPRVWGGFYSSPRILTKLSQMSKRKLICSPVLRSIIGKTTSHDPASRPTLLWSYIAYKMMLPLWCTSCGQESFWTFTYLLIKAALGKSYGDKIPELVSRLYTSDIGSGFRSWIDWYKMKDDSPKWVRGMLGELALSGPSSLVRISSIANYV